MTHMIRIRLAIAPASPSSPVSGLSALRPAHEQLAALPPAPAHGPLAAVVDPSAVAAGLFVALLLAAVVVVLGYAALCALWPYKPCRRCHGTSRHVTRRGRIAHPCFRCRSTGLRLRVGRRAWNRAMRFRHARRIDRHRAANRDRRGGGDPWNGNS